MTIAAILLLLILLSAVLMARRKRIAPQEAPPLHSAVFTDLPKGSECQTAPKAVPSRYWQDQVS